MAQINKNTVAAENQLKVKVPVFYENEGGKGLRVLFVGNSITRHGRKDEIGWYADDYGMAASSKENDYVHLLMKEIDKKYEDVAYCIYQASEWEVNYKKGYKDLLGASKACEFNADIIIMRIVENCSTTEFSAEDFEREYKALIDYLNQSGNAKVILTTSFWHHRADDTIIRLCQERGYKTVLLGDLGEDDSMKAIGFFEHYGVANHPGDSGMKLISERIAVALEL